MIAALIIHSSHFCSCIFGLWKGSINNPLNSLYYREYGSYHSPMHIALACGGLLCLIMADWTIAVWGRGFGTVNSLEF